jgi:plastocyanin
MTTFTQPMPSQRRTRARTLLLSIGVVLVLIIIGLSIPSNRRWLANPTGQPAHVGVTTIMVVGDQFQSHVYAPSVVRVPVNTTITWIFADRGANQTEELVPHNVVGTDWASAVLSEGSYQHTFTSPGIYRYTCTLHRNMDGIIEVTAN